VVAGSTVGFLEVVDLLAGQVRYIPVPEPQHESAYASWYKQTYPDKVSCILNQAILLFCPLLLILFFRIKIIFCKFQLQSFS